MFTLAEVIALALTALTTAQQMQANGQATTTAEQDKALADASNAADAAHLAEQGATGSE